MASNLIAIGNGLQPKSDGLEPSSDGLRPPTSNGLQPNRDGPHQHVTPRSFVWRRLSRWSHGFTSSQVY